VGDDLLVAGHRGREHGLAERVPGARDALAAEDSAVLQDDEPVHAANTTRPAATVRTTLPRTRLSRSHEFAERERKPSSRTRQEASVSSRTRFAGAPTAIRGRSRPKIRAGPADMRWRSVSSVSRPGSTRPV